jgi:cell division protein FtsA
MDAAERSIRAAVDQAERSAGVTIEDVILSVSCGRLKSDNFSASAAIAGAEVGPGDIERVAAAGRDYAARGGRSVLHCISTGYRLDGDIAISDPRGMIADQLSLDIHAVSVDEAPLKNLILCVERCHLSVVDLAAAPYASGLASIVDDEAKIGVTCIDLGAGTTGVSVFSDENFLFSDCIAIGGNHVTMDLARSLSTPLQEAERIKTLHGSAFAAASDEREMVEFPIVGENDAPRSSSVTRAQVAQLIQPRIEEILVLVRDRLDAAGLTDIAGSHVVLNGGGSQLTGLREFAGRVLSKAVRLGRPRSVPGLPEQGVGPAFAAGVGLLVYSQRDTGGIVRRARKQYLGTGTGYLALVSQWIKESF